MKKSIFLSVVILFSAHLAKAQTDAESLLKQDIANLNNQETMLEKQKKADKSQIRKIENSIVNYQAKEAFYRDFGDVAVTKAIRTNNFDEFTFPKDGQFATAYYDWSNNLVGTSENKTFADIPGKAQLYILDKYPTYKVGQVVFYDDNEQNDTDMILYEQSFEDADNYFVALKKDNKTMIVKVNMAGDVEYFADMK